jgi:hypothetical protein
MKKKFAAVFIGMVLVFGLIVIGCPTDNGGGDLTTKFEETWRNPNGVHNTYKFTGNTF